MSSVPKRHDFIQSVRTKCANSAHVIPEEISRFRFAEVPALQHLEILDFLPVTASKAVAV